MTRATLPALHELLDRVAALSGAHGLPAAAEVERIRAELCMPRLLQAAPESPLTCPRCGTESKQLGEYVYRCWTDARVQGPAIRVAMDSDELMPEAVLTPERAWCDPCASEFELPCDIQILWT